MFWIYEIPSWLFFIFCNLFFIVVSLQIRNYVQKKLISKFNVTEKHNDLLNYFVIALGAFYSITLGLIAVDTWEYFKDSNQLIHNEAANISALYKDLNYYPEEICDKLQTNLKDYTSTIINEEWGSQQRGIIPTQADLPLKKFQNQLYNFNPINIKSQIIHSVAISKFNDLVKLRSNRLNSITEGLPRELWLVIFTEALLMIFLFSFFVEKNAKIHKLLIVSLGIVIGTTIFLVAVMNFPYRGHFSVNPEAYKLVLNNMN